MPFIKMLIMFKIVTCFKAHKDTQVGRGRVGWGDGVNYKSLV